MALEKKKQVSRARPYLLLFPGNRKDWRTPSLKIAYPARAAQVTGNVGVGVNAPSHIHHSGGTCRGCIERKVQGRGRTHRAWVKQGQAAAAISER